MPHPAENFQWLPTAVNLKSSLLDLPYKALEIAQASHIVML